MIAKHITTEFGSFSLSLTLHLSVICCLYMGTKQITSSLVSLIVDFWMIFVVLLSLCVSSFWVLSSSKHQTLNMKRSKHFHFFPKEEILFDYTLNGSHRLFSHTSHHCKIQLYSIFTISPFFHFPLNAQQAYNWCLISSFNVFLFPFIYFH